MPQTQRHKVFISYYYEDDEVWKDRFVRIMRDRIVDKSVKVGDIVDHNIPIEDALRRVREEHIAEATVTVVLIGPRTWKRKFVDWEINATLRDTDMNPRCGLLGILLPCHPGYRLRERNLRLAPPRLADNCTGNDPFARIYDWPGSRVRRRAEEIQNWIHQAYMRRLKQPDPNNGRRPFARNWRGDPARGWQN